MMIRKFAPLVAIVFLLGACQGTGPKQQAGTVVGAGLGALAGSQIGSGSGQLAAVAIGTLLGAYLGSSIGESLDAADQTRHNQAYNQAQTAPLNQPVVWNNPNNNTSGSVTATRDGTNSSGAYCREFEQTITVDGKTETRKGTACQQPDGSWKVLGS
jgi:surface antigen